MTDKQYEMLLDLFNNWGELFDQLPVDVMAAFYERLYNRR
jgi:hypothetical protein